MNNINPKTFIKFSFAMFLSLILVYGTAYFTAFHGFDILADISGGWALGIWLIIIAISAIIAFIIRRQIWSMSFSSSLALLITYSVIAGIMFSVFFLGDSLIGIIIVSLIFILSAIYNSPRALLMKNSSRAAVIWALSVYLGVMMVLAFWVLIWGAWDTTKRRYSKKKS